MRVYNDNPEDRFIVELYLDCRDSQSWPAQGTLGNQTAYCASVFGFLDGIVHEWKEQRRKEDERKANAERRKIENQMKGSRPKKG